jgi:hypothetical protein
MTGQFVPITAAALPALIVAAGEPASMALPGALLCWRVTRLRARSGARSAPRHHRRRYAIAVAEEAQNSDPDLKPTRSRGNVGLISATFSARGRDARYYRRLPLRSAAL